MRMLGCLESWASERKDMGIPQQVALLLSLWRFPVSPAGFSEAGETVGCRQRACHLREAGGCPGLCTPSQPVESIPSGVAERAE